MRDREIADAIADVCDGRDVSREERLAVQLALRGPVQTDDRGLRVFYVQLDTCAEQNVDTAECIWSEPVGASKLSETYFPLTMLRYGAFWKRVAKPLLEEIE